MCRGVLNNGTSCRVTTTTRIRHYRRNALNGRRALPALTTSTTNLYRDRMDLEVTGRKCERRRLVSLVIVACLVIITLSTAVRQVVEYLPIGGTPCETLSPPLGLLVGVDGLADDAMLVTAVIAVLP